VADPIKNALAWLWPDCPKAHGKAVNAILADDDLAAALAVARDYLTERGEEAGARLLARLSGWCAILQPAYDRAVAEAPERPPSLEELLRQDGGAAGVLFLDRRVEGTVVQIVAMPRASRGSIARLYLQAGDATGWIPKLADLRKNPKTRRRHLLQMLQCILQHAGG
jgi:hypothetical protein